MHILVTGGAGYIGSHTVRALLAQGHRVLVLDNLSRGHRQAVPAEVTLITEDIHHIDTVRDIMELNKIEAVVHFAAHSQVGESMDNPTIYYDNNIVGFEVEDIVLNSIQIKFTKNRILEALRKKTNERIESEYPWYKQNNINELQGYSEEDKNSMWIFINSIRQETNNLEEQIKNALTLKQLKIIESEM